MPEAMEKDQIRRGIDVVKSITHQPAIGWYTGRDSPNTKRLVADCADIAYDSDYYGDDLPFWMNIKNSLGQSIPQLIVPYTLDCNDMRFSLPQGYAQAEDFFIYLKDTFDAFAMCAGPEDVFLALRGLRTMELRLREAERQGLALANWLKSRPEVLRVLHPALPDDPGHAIWKRDFSGASGLFSIILKPCSKEAVAALLDGLELFGMGYSWGGFESLVIPFDCSTYRTATKWNPGGPALRFQVGLEDIEDLKEDLERGFARLTATE
jgi:hypothetical protein